MAEFVGRKRTDGSTCSPYAVSMPCSIRPSSPSRAMILRGCGSGAGGWGRINLEELTKLLHCPEVTCSEGTRHSSRRLPCRGRVTPRATQRLGRGVRPHPRLRLTGGHCAAPSLHCGRWPPPKHGSQHRRLFRNRVESRTAMQEQILPYAVERDLVTQLVVSYDCYEYPRRTGFPDRFLKGLQFVDRHARCALCLVAGVVRNACLPTIF